MWWAQPQQFNPMPYVNNSKSCSHGDTSSDRENECPQNGALILEGRLVQKSSVENEKIKIKELN